MKNTSFVDFKTALIIVRDLNINSVTEWRKWIKVNKDKKYLITLIHSIKIVDG